jgi:DNA-binding GntR family transcriptional regulator
VPRRRDKAYEVMRQRLVGGHYQPGTQLKEEPLARELGLSRTPVRTALKRLVEEGLATADEGQGVHVAKWTERDIEETFQLRMLLEPQAAYFAAVRGGDDLVAGLQASNRSMAEAIDSNSVTQIQEANRDFHRTLVDAAKSPRLKAMLQTIIDMPIITRSFSLATPAERKQSLNHHNDLTTAVIARDGELARQVMHLHLRMAYHRFMQHRDQIRSRK